MNITSLDNTYVVKAGHYSILSLFHFTEEEIEAQGG